MQLNAIPTHPEANSYLTVEEADALIGRRPNDGGWSQLEGDQKTAVLMQVTAMIDSFRFHHEPFYKYPANYRNSQALKFPLCTARAQSCLNSAGGSNFVTSSQLANRPDMPTDFWKGGVVVISNGTGKGQTREVLSFDPETGKVIVTENFTVTPDNTSYFRIISDIPLAVKMAVVEQALFTIGGGFDRATMRAEGVQSYQIGDLSETFGEGGSGSIPFSPIAKTYLRSYISKIGRMIA